jgi:hypothetical protein
MHVLHCDLSLAIGLQSTHPVPHGIHRLVEIINVPFLHSQTPPTIFILGLSVQSVHKVRELHLAQEAGQFAHFELSLKNLSSQTQVMPIE